VTGKRSGLKRSQIAAVAAGNALDFYDFVTYSFFAVQIGRTLFPGDASQSLILSLATFGVGFVSRPLGGWVIGRMADRRGRKPAMILSFTLMGIGIVGLALTPSYHAIGITASILAVAFRLLQGFALGGEVGPNASCSRRRHRTAAVSIFRSIWRPPTSRSCLPASSGWHCRRG